MIKLFSALCFSLLATAVGAQDIAPDAMIKSITNEVIGIIKQDKDIKAGNRTKINELVEAKVLPHFNFDRMTALAMGRNWRKADAEQQKQLISEFRTLLVRTYSGALADLQERGDRVHAAARRRGGHRCHGQDPGQAAGLRADRHRLQHGEDR